MHRRHRRRTPEDHVTHRTVGAWQDAPFVRMFYTAKGLRRLPGERTAGACCAVSHKHVEDTKHHHREVPQVLCRLINREDLDRAVEV